MEIELYKENNLNHSQQNENNYSFKIEEINTEKIEKYLNSNKNNLDIILENSKEYERSNQSSTKTITK